MQTTLKKRYGLPQSPPEGDDCSRSKILYRRDVPAAGSSAAHSSTRRALAPFFLSKENERKPLYQKNTTAFLIRQDVSRGLRRKIVAERFSTQEIKNALGIHSPGSVFAGIGENLMLGLWNGISDSVGWILDKARDFGGTLIDTVKSVFGIASPSKVFADEIGKNLGLGVGVSFEDAMRDVSKDMADAIPTDFDVAANVHGTPEVMPGSGGGISLTLNIENFHNYRSEDINELADELSVILASKMNRKAATF